MFIQCHITAIHIFKSPSIFSFISLFDGKLPSTGQVLFKTHIFKHKSHDVNRIYINKRDEYFGHKEDLSPIPSIKIFFLNSINCQCFCTPPHPPNSWKWIKSGWSMHQILISGGFNFFFAFVTSQGNYRARKQLSSTFGGKFMLPLNFKIIMLNC